MAARYGPRQAARAARALRSINRPEGRRFGGRGRGGSMTLTMHLAQVVEDDRAAQRVLSMVLESDGFRVMVSDTCMRGELDATLRPPDVMIVDLGLPDRDGIFLIKSIRTWSPVPILVLSARTA